MFGRRLLVAAGLVAASAPLALAQSPTLTRGEASSLPSPVVAQGGTRARVVSGGEGHLQWKAANRIVGVTSTGTVASGGDPIYLAPQPNYNGVVSLIMNYGAGGSFICTGTLLPDRRSILTAAHCVSSGAGTDNPLSTTAYFYNGPNAADPTPDPQTFLSPASTPVAVQSYFVHPQYTGEVIDQNDIAILRLDAPAPAWANSYGIDFSAGLTGRDFNVAGYGGRSSGGGDVGANLGVGRLRQGDNRMDFRLGDSEFGGFFTQPSWYGPQAEYSYVSDFDNGTATNDAGCRLAVDGLGLVGSTKFCNLGRGATEVGVAGGDSGGPQFGLDGRLISVTSYGLSFGAAFGDRDNALNSTFGEFSGYVPLYIHQGFIASSTVPEPSTYALFGTGLLALGFLARRRSARS